MFKDIGWKKYVENCSEFQDKIEISDEINLEIKTGNDDEDQILSTDLIKNALDLSNHYTEKHTCKSIANEQLSKLKRIKPSHITTISQWNDFVKKHKILYTSLHRNFESEWICWGDFLLNKTFSYEESKNTIQKYFCNKFKTVDEWIKFYHQMIDQEITQTRNNDVQDLVISQLIHIPNKPKKHYENDWIDWPDFLGSQLQVPTLDLTCFLNTTKQQQFDEFGSSNIHVLINDDQNLINTSVKKEKWITICMEQNYTNKIEQYIRKRFGIDPDIVYHVRTKYDGSFDKMRVLCGQKNNYNSNTSIVLFLDIKKIKYAKLSNNNPNCRQTNPNCRQTNEVSIHDDEFGKLLDRLTTDSKMYIESNPSTIH